MNDASCLSVWSEETCNERVKVNLKKTAFKWAHAYTVYVYNSKVNAFSHTSDGISGLQKKRGGSVKGAVR